MSAATAIVCLVLLAGLLTAQTPQATRKAPPPKRTELFVGNGSLSWLPKSAILPTALDLNTRAQKLGSRVRNMDPFALAMFPKEEALQSPLADPSRPTERITLNQALQGLKLNGINLQKKEILMRGQNVFEGDVMMLSFRNEIFFAQIMEVSATQILFRDVKRQETGVLPHSIVPHLDLEPMKQRSGRGDLAGKVTPMEKPKPLQP